MRRVSHHVTVSTTTLLIIGAICATSLPAAAACVTDASGNATCDGVVTTPLTVYDAAAKYQPVNGSNAYTPTSYSKNPPTVFVTIDPGATLAITTNTTASLADRGIIAANYSNAENPAVNNVEVDNSGTVALTTAQISAGRMHAIVSDSQVNTFTVVNAATGVISATQNYFAAYNPALLSTTSSGTPPTYTAKYNGTTLAIVSALYSDDNTNSFVINNTGKITASGNFAAAYYGRADTTIVNSGTLGNLGWSASDKIYAGHWALGTYAGADFATVAGSNPDTPLYDVQNIATNAQGYPQGTLAVTDTSATTVTNKAGGTITGDILVLDTNPLVTAAAAAKGQALPLAVSGSNSGPRDSTIENYGTINGNFYLGSGAHTIDNAAGATLTGAINVDQRASVGSFATGVPGTVAGTYQSVGPGTASSTGAACPAAGANTTDPYCAKTTNVYASFYGARTFSLTNEGTLTGNVTLNDQAGSVNAIKLTGTGFTGFIIAQNGLGSNTLTLDGVTTLSGVQNFSTLNLMRSNVAVAGGVSLVDGATIHTTIYGPGGTAGNPSTNLGSINGMLTLEGDTRILPRIASTVTNGAVYELASQASSAGAITVRRTALVSFTPETGTGAPIGGSGGTTADVAAGPNALLLKAHVRDAATAAPGITTPGAQTIDGLTSYTGSDRQVQALGAAVESLTSGAQVAAAGRALSPIVNGADIQIPINSAMLFHQQIDSRLDTFIYSQIPASGRSADLGVPRPTPVYGVVPPNGAWIEGIGGGVTQGTRNGVTGYNAELEGVIGGYDRLIAPAFRVGGAFGYINGNVNGNVNTTGAREDIQTYQGLVYAAYEGPRTYLRGSFGYGGVNFDDQRAIAFGNFSDRAFGTHGGDILTARGEGGVPVEVHDSLIVPYGAFTYSRLEQDAYREQSSLGAGLGYAGVANDSERSEVGGKVIVPIGFAPVFTSLFPLGSVAAFEARAAYVHEFGNVAQQVSASFTGGNSFLVTGPTPDRDMLDYSVGLRVGSGPVQIDLSYNALARASYYQQVGLLRARVLF